MVLDRLIADPEPAGDLFVGVAPRDVFEHFDFAPGEGREDALGDLAVIERSRNCWSTRVATLGRVRTVSLIRNSPRDTRRITCTRSSGSIDRVQ